MGKTFLFLFIAIFSFNIDIFALSDKALDDDHFINGKDYTVDVQGNVSVLKILEKMNCKKSDIYKLSQYYLENAYKEMKYTITDADDVNGVVIGRGKYENFFSMNSFPNTYYLDAEITVRIDAKDGRARIIISAEKYSGRRINGNNKDLISDKIVDFEPINKTNEKYKRLYTKAFQVLISRMRKTACDIENYLNTSMPQKVDSNW
jgi:hypothetical protein